MTSAAIPRGVAAVHRLGAGLFRELAARPGNLALSPYSAAAALGMTLDGAAGRTRDEMLVAFGVDSVADLDAGMHALTRHLEILADAGDALVGPVEIRTANRLFGQADDPWAPTFLDTLAATYDAALSTVDYAGATEAARQAINEWTAAQTRDRIRDIVPPGVLTSLTRLVLVNALYFKARWLEQFEPGVTRDGPFHLADGSTVEVPMMSDSLRSTAYARGDGWQAVRLSYVGGRLAMTIVLPDAGRLADVESAVGEGALPGIVASAGRAPVELFVPRWTFRTQADLTDALASLGMPSLFDRDTADLSAMVTTPYQLWVDAVLQQVFVAVDEHGTEAAAATAVVVRTLSASVEPPLQVVVDRPFLFTIHDVEHGTPLFVGRVADPRS